MSAPLAFPALAADPERQRGWWDALSAEARTAAEREYPEEIGPREGLPYGVRHRANLALLRAARVRIEEEHAVASDVPGRWARYTGVPTRRQVSADKLQACERIEEVVRRGDGDRHLLYVQTEADLLEAVVARGPLDTAAHIVVVLGGVDTMVHASLEAMDNEAGALIGGAQDQLTKAGRGGERIAVVNLLYPVPRTGGLRVVGAAVGWRADVAARTLLTILAGLRERRPDARCVVFGHSYGSYAVGRALVRYRRAELADVAAGVADPGGRPLVEDVLFYGSPGLGVARLCELGIRAGHVFDMEAPEDVIADLGWFGADPTGLAGIEHLSAAPGVSPDGVVRSGLAEYGRSAHARYHVGGSMSHYNMCAVAAGLLENVVRDPAVEATRGPRARVALYRRLAEPSVRAVASRLVGGLVSRVRGMVGRLRR